MAQVDESLEEKVAPGNAYTGPIVSQVNLRYKPGQFSIKDVVSSFSLPRVVVYDVDSQDKANVNMSQPFLLYSERHVTNIIASSLMTGPKLDKTVEVGHPLIIPEDYPGWFSVCESKDPQSPNKDVFRLEQIADVLKFGCYKFLIGGQNHMEALQVEKKKDGSTSHSHRLLYPGDILQVGKTCFLDNPRSEKKGTLRKSLKKLGKKKSDTFTRVQYLQSRDEKDRELLIPFHQTGVFYPICDVTDRDSRGIMRIADILKRYELPCAAEHIYGRVPRTNCCFTGMLMLKDKIKESSVMASTIFNVVNIFLELPFETTARFRAALHDAPLIYNKNYKETLRMCKQNMDMFQKKIKVQFSVKVAKQRGKRESNDVSSVLLRNEDVPVYKPWEATSSLLDRWSQNGAKWMSIYRNMHSLQYINQEESDDLPIQSSAVASTTLPRVDSSMGRPPAPLPRSSRSADFLVGAGSRCTRTDWICDESMSADNQGFQVCVPEAHIMSNNDYFEPTSISDDDEGNDQNQNCSNGRNRRKSHGYVNGDVINWWNSMDERFVDSYLISPLYLEDVVEDNTKDQCVEVNDQDGDYEYPVNGASIPLYDASGRNVHGHREHTLTAGRYFFPGSRFSLPTRCIHLRSDSRCCGARTSLPPRHVNPDQGYISPVSTSSPTTRRVMISQRDDEFGSKTNVRVKNQPPNRERNDPPPPPIPCGPSKARAGYVIDNPSESELSKSTRPHSRTSPPEDYDHHYTQADPIPHLNSYVPNCDRRSTSAPADQKYEAFSHYPDSQSYSEKFRYCNFLELSGSGENNDLFSLREEDDENDEDIQGNLSSVDNGNDTFCSEYEPSPDQTDDLPLGASSRSLPAFLQSKFSGSDSGVLLDSDKETDDDN